MISFNGKMRPKKFCKSFPAKSITITYSQLKKYLVIKFSFKTVANLINDLPGIVNYYSSISTVEGTRVNVSKYSSM